MLMGEEYLDMRQDLSIDYIIISQIVVSRTHSGLNFL